MKKKILTLLSVMVLTTTLSFAATNKYANSELSKAIKLYKAANYSECYTTLESVLKNDPTNALAYYYMAMTNVQMGKRSEAVENYDKAIVLSDMNGKLIKYATLGKVCLQDSKACTMEEKIPEIEKLMSAPKFDSFSDAARGEIEKLKIENLMRDINRSEDITPDRFRDYKDFSSMNFDEPSNEELIAALRTLQKAGLGVGTLLGNNSPDYSMLLNNMGTQNTLYNQLGNTSLSPQVIQAMLTNNLSLGF